MQLLTIFAILCTLVVVVPSAPVEDKAPDFPLPWQTILKKAIEFLRLYDGTFDSMRHICEDENTAIGFMISEQVILAHRKTIGVVMQVIHKINDKRLTCKDIRFHTEEVINIFLDTIRFLLDTPEISNEGKGHLRAIYVGTVLDSSKIINQVASLVGCPRP